MPGEGPGLEQVSAVGRLLYLGQAQPAQEGTYTCECSNVAGGSSQDQQLEVHGERGWETCPGGRVIRGGDQAPRNLGQDRTGDGEDTFTVPLRLLASDQPLLPGGFLQPLT